MRIPAAPGAFRLEAILCLFIAASCHRDEAPKALSNPPGENVRVRTLTLGAFTTPREAYGKALLPAFRTLWRQKTGEELRFEESYLGSGAQSRAIIAGFEADVAALSLEPDVQKIVEAGLIKHDWKKALRGGMVTRSIVVIGVRPGNPKNIHEWKDLTRSDVDVLTPNVKTSGGAMWNVLALVGATQRGKVDGVTDPEQFLAMVLARVKMMDKGARESMLSFELGVGDAIITYENEILVAREAGEKCDYVVPASTIRIDNPVAVVDAWADKHGNQEVARAFVDFLISAEAQGIFARHGMRPVDAELALKETGNLPNPTDLFTIEDLGGWTKLVKEIFQPRTMYDRALGQKVASR